MIHSKKELDFYIAADRIMNGRSEKRSFAEILLDRVSLSGKIISYLQALRKCAYYSQYLNKGLLMNSLRYYYWFYKYKRLGLTLGFSIGYNSIGYGVCIPHYGTIVIGNSNKIGNYAVLHTCTCISDNGKEIGDALYLSTGVKITSKVRLGNGISIGANSLVNKSFEGDNLLIAGMPAKVIRESAPWFIRDCFEDRVLLVESIKSKYIG